MPSKEEKNAIERVQKFPVGTVVEISIIGVFPASEFPALQRVVEKFQADLRAEFELIGGRDAYNRWAEARPATKEELLHFTPRKRHFTTTGSDHACSCEYVARRNLTRNREEVTCKLCRRKLGLVVD